MLSRGVFFREPSSAAVCELLERAVEAAGAEPAHLISDKGAQFFGRDEETQYQLWCKARGIRMRFGAVGKKGSIAIVERVILSLKTEATGRVMIPYGVEAMASMVESYRGWYNEHRPHTALGGKTPDEVFYGRRSVRDLPRYEPRPRFPLGRPPARGAPVAVRGKRGVEVALVVSHHEELTVLPVVKLRRAA